jgi:TonB family protein
VSAGNEPARKVSSASKNTGEPLSDLANRKVIGAIVKPECNFDEEGTIIVDITVTPKGKVIKAEVNTKQTICANPNLRNAALAAARQTRFNEVEEVEEQKGTITYNFRLITKISGKINGHEYIDLGLPSGLKWATCNVGALSPEEYGDYYAWGETEQKKDYCIETYKWFDSSNMMTTKYCTDSSNGIVDNKTTLDSQDDVAHVKWGGTWRMPTEAEQDELRNICTWTWTTQNGVNGYKVTGPNGNSIFLPAAGLRYGTDLYYSGSHGLFWSSSLYEGYGDSAYYLYFDSSDCGWSYNNRYYGLSVRPVSE